MNREHLLPHYQQVKMHILEYIEQRNWTLATR